jgi:hypothetical protein
MVELTGQGVRSWNCEAPAPEGDGGFTFLGRAGQAAHMGSWRVFPSAQSSKPVSPKKHPGSCLVKLIPKMSCQGFCHLAQSAWAAFQVML